VIEAIVGDVPIELHAAGQISVEANSRHSFSVKVDNRTLLQRSQELLDQGRSKPALAAATADFNAKMDGRASSTLAEIWSILGHDEDSLQACDMALKLAPKSASIYAIRSLILAKLARIDSSHADAWLALQLVSGSSVEDELTRARALIALGQQERAATILTDLIAHHLQCWRALFYRSTAYRAQGKTQLAQADQKRLQSLAQSPESIEGDVGEGFSLNGKGMDSEFPDTATMIGLMTDRSGARIGSDPHSTEQCKP
jgi:tetratricopeptide (TPR) repeat protein